MISEHGVVMKKIIRENILVLLIASLATILGIGLILYVLFADTIRTEIISASPVNANTYEVEEIRSKDDPDYDPVYNKTKTVNETKYHRSVIVEVDGKKEKIELSSEFPFMLPGEGQKITISRSFDNGYEWEHPVQNFLLGCVLAAGGSAVIVSTIKPGLKKKISSKSTKKKHKKK